MTVKPWQKATLSVMAGTAIYAGFLYKVTEHTQQQNQVAFKQWKAVIAENKALEATFQEKKAKLVALEKQLHSIQASNSKTATEIKVVKEQMLQIRAGNIPGASIPSIPVSTAPTQAVPVSNIQPPPVQSVTKASGLP